MKWCFSKCLIYQSRPLPGLVWCAIALYDIVWYVLAWMLKVHPHGLAGAVLYGWYGMEWFNVCVWFDVWYDLIQCMCLMQKVQPPGFAWWCTVWLE